MTKMGRPPKQIDWRRAEELMEKGCCGREIASYFGMHQNRFYDKVQKEKGCNFTEFSARHYDRGNIYIREAQYDKAVKKKDNTMLIWLGKQRLNQSEHPRDLIPQEINTQYLQVISQLAALQSARKIDESKSSKETKSACETGE